MKRITAIILMIILTFSFILTSGAQDAPKLESSSLTLDSAISYALVNNPSIAINEGKVKAAKVNLTEAKSAQSRMKRTGMSAESFEGTLMAEGYYVRLADSGITLSEKAVEQTKQLIKLKVESDYFTYRNSLQKREKAAGILALADNNLNYMKLRKDMGMVSELEVMQAELARTKAAADKSAADRSVEQARRSLCATLNVPLTTAIALTDNVTELPFPEVDLNKRLTEALENRMEVVAAREQAASDKVQFEIMPIWYGANTYKYQKLQYQLQNDNYTLESAREQVELSVYKAYDDMKTAYEMLPVLRDSEALAEKVYNVTKLKLESGMATGDDLLDALNKLQEAQINTAAMRLTYNLSVINFENSYGVGTTTAAGY